MAKIHRSLKNVQGDMTVTDGDVVVTDTTKGIIMTDNVGDTDRMKIVDDSGTKAIEVEQI